MAKQIVAVVVLGLTVLIFGVAARSNEFTEALNRIEKLENRCTLLEIRVKALEKAPVAQAQEPVAAVNVALTWEAYRKLTIGPTQAQQDATWRAIVGTRVRWGGRVAEVKGDHVYLEMGYWSLPTRWFSTPDMREARRLPDGRPPVPVVNGNIALMLQDESEKQKALSLRKKQEIVFSGVLERTGKLTDGRIERVR